LSGSRAAWSLTTESGDDSTISGEGEKKGYRFFKIKSTGVNANGGRELALGGLEFYGTVCAAHDSGDTNLLQYLDGIISSDRSSEGIRRFLRHIRSQDSTDDESLSQFMWPKKLSPGASPVVCDVTSSQTQEVSAAVHESGETNQPNEDPNLVPPSAKWTRAAVSEMAIEPQQRGRPSAPQPSGQQLQQSSGDDNSNDSATKTVLDKASNPIVADTIPSIERMHHHHHAHSALGFLDQSAGADLSRSQTTVCLLHLLFKDVLAYAVTCVSSQVSSSFMLPDR
uniref:CIA30 domain-containing protein n=1 Tax=Echinostoma caproni TaxID=27848 RepID=A0A183B894_9TREM